MLIMKIMHTMHYNKLNIRVQVYVHRILRIVTLVIPNLKLYRSDLFCFSHDLEKRRLSVIYCRLVELLTWCLFERDREIFPDARIFFFYLKTTQSTVSNYYISLFRFSSVIIIYIIIISFSLPWYLTLIMHAFNFNSLEKINRNWKYRRRLSRK